MQVRRGENMSRNLHLLTECVVRVEDITCRPASILMYSTSHFELLKIILFWSFGHSIHLAVQLTFPLALHAFQVTQNFTRLFLRCPSAFLGAVEVHLNEFGSLRRCSRQRVFMSRGVDVAVLQARFVCLPQWGTVSLERSLRIGHRLHTLQNPSANSRWPGQIHWSPFLSD